MQFQQMSSLPICRKKTLKFWFMCLRNMTFTSCHCWKSNFKDLKHNECLLIRLRFLWLEFCVVLRHDINILIDLEMVTMKCFQCLGYQTNILHILCRNGGSTTRGLQNNDDGDDDDEDRHQQAWVMAGVYSRVSIWPVHRVAICMINGE